MRRVVNGVLWLIGLLAVLVASFVLPLGRYTLFEHARRIAATEPAQDLGHGIGAAGESLEDSAREEWERRLKESEEPPR